MIQCAACLQEFDPAAAGGACPRCALAAALAAAGPDPATSDYEPVAELGRGGMGTVTLVRQRSLDRLVALKVIAAGPDPDGRAESRLLREARAAAAIAHPHVVAVHEVGHGPAGAFIAMEYCEGGDLRDRLRSGPLAPRAAAELVAKLADAIARAHVVGVFHRDLKPSNVLLTAAGEPKLADFGLSSSAAGGEVTRSGVVAGSPAYLAPEVLQPGHGPAPAQDIYGLGAILYECLTGRPPFVGDTVAAVLAQIGSAEPPAPRLLSRSLPRDLETITLKCLEKKPAARYATAADLRDDLRRFLAGHPILARPVSPAGRALRWARRNPALAAALAVIVLGAATGAVLLAERNLRLAQALARAERASGEAREALRESLLAQAHATRLTGLEGHRRDALAAVTRAAAIRPGADARTEAIAALSLPEWSPHTATKVWSEPGLSTATPLPGLRAFIHETPSGEFSRRTFPEGRVEWTWPGLASPSAGQTVVSPDGRWVAVRLQNDEIHVLSAATGQPAFALPGRPFVFKDTRIWGYGVDMAFSPDGARLAATRPEGGLTVHAVPDGGQLAAWDSPARLVCLAWSHNGRWLAAGGSRQREHNTVALLDAADLRPLAQDVPTGRVDFLAWSGDDRWLAVGSRPVQVRATADFSVRAVVPDRAALHGHFLPDADQLLLSEQIGSTRLWDIDTGRLLLTKPDSGRPGVWFDGHPVTQWRYFSDGRVDLQTLESSPILTAHRPMKVNPGVTNIADPLDISPDNRWLVLGTAQRVVLVEAATGEAFPLGEIGATHFATAGRLEADGTTLWVGESGRPLRRLRMDFSGSRPVVSAAEQVPGHDGFLPTAIHRASGLLALTHYQEGRVRVLDTRTRGTRAEWNLPRASHAEFSPDGRWILSNAEPTPDGRAEIREAATGRVEFVPGPGAGRISSWSADGRWVLAGTGRDTRGLWRVGTWQPGPAIPDKAQSSSMSAALSPDGRWLVLRKDQEFELLRTDTMELLARIPIPGSVSYLPALRFAPDGHTLVAVRLDGRIDRWDLRRLRTELAALGLDWPD